MNFGGNAGITGNYGDDYAINQAQSM